MSDPNEASKPTAAELLARADMLMRKNREVFEDDIPLLEETVDLPELTSAAIEAPPDWDLVCENVYSRVMRQLDLYAEFGLKDRIRREIRPKLNDWIDQFSIEVSRELSDNIRKFVAQAIEEEVARMRAARKPDSTR